jgi:hypothetical protein
MLDRVVGRRHGHRRSHHKSSLIPASTKGALTCWYVIGWAARPYLMTQPASTGNVTPVM